MEEDIHSLKSGTLINNYVIIKVLGEGGFGITYLATDRQLGLEVVIKEYFPNEFAMRAANSTITAKRTSVADFSKGIQRFKEEAQTLAKFNHPSIVKILGYFESNDTAYFVMEYEEGLDLSQYLKQQNRSLKQDEILGIMVPIMEGLKEVHKYNFLHRDIKPGNILLRSNSSPVLIDFGASKQTITDVSKSVTSMLTEGYAPLEQYSTDIKQQGPFTDIYAVAAVIYKMITGKVPPSAQTRSYQLLSDGNDPYISLQILNLEGYDHHFLNAIDRALSIKAKERPQNIQDFQLDIIGKLKIKEPTKERVSKKNTNNKTAKTSSNKSLLFISLGLITIGSIAGFLFFQDSSITDKKITTVKKDIIKKDIIKKTKTRTHVSKTKEQACHDGDLKACTNLGTSFVTGKDKSKNHKKAVDMFTKACNGKYARGCYNLGVMHVSGQGVTQDYFKALDLFNKACTYGDARGCVSVGLMYEKGEGAKQNDKKAANFYKKACDKGDTEGCVSLGYMCENGKGVEKDSKKAVELYQKSCKAGDSSGCTNLGFMYASGQGVTKNISKATEFYKKACDDGDSVGCANYNKLK